MNLSLSEEDYNEMLDLRGLQTKKVDRNNHLNKKEIRLEGQRKETAIN